MARLDGEVVAVTGASGFIGARLVEHLIAGSNARVRALIRSYDRLSRLSELPQDRLSFHVADVARPAAVREAVGDASIIVHCAFGSHGDEQAQFDSTVEGARCVAEAAGASARRLVHLSTAAIHDPRGLEAFDEDSPLVEDEGLTYENAKLQAERIMLAARCPTVALRPTVVYGPWGRDWTITPLQRLTDGVRGLPGGGAAHPSNAVYVDDVVGAILSACERDCVGPILVAGAEPLSWAAFYDAYRAMLGSPPGGGDGADLPEWEQQLYSQPAMARLDRARDLLGYRPRVSHARGMALVEAWYGWWTGRVAAPAALSPPAQVGGQTR